MSLQRRVLTTIVPSEKLSPQVLLQQVCTHTHTELLPYDVDKQQISDILDTCTKRFSDFFFFQLPHFVTQDVELKKPW